MKRHFQSIWRSAFSNQPLVYQNNVKILWLVQFFYVYSEHYRIIFEYYICVAKIRDKMHWRSIQSFTTKIVLFAVFFTVLFRRSWTIGVFKVDSHTFHSIKQDEVIRIFKAFSPRMQFIATLCAHSLERIEGFSMPMHIRFILKTKLLIWYHFHFKCCNNISARQNSIQLFCCALHSLFLMLGIIWLLLINLVTSLTNIPYQPYMLCHEDGHFESHFCGESVCQFTL